MIMRKKRYPQSRSTLNLMIFNRKSYLITVVNNKRLYFVAPGQTGGNAQWNIADEISVEDFLSDGNNLEFIEKNVRNLKNSLLIVPDYWLGNTSYVFHSKKRPIVETFVKRKLKDEYPDLGEIEYFFDYSFQTVNEERGLYVFFMRNPGFFQLHKRLAKLNFSPRRITTPAFLWEQKLKKKTPDFNNGGKCLVCMLSSECFLYFFFEGNFLFSRDIALPDPQSGPDSQADPSERFNALSYEINQSLYLFSQKAKAQIDRIYLFSYGEKDAKELSDILAREITDLNALDEQGATTEIVRQLGPAASFNDKELLSLNFLSLSHKMLKKELDWLPVQTAGIVVGIVLLLLLGAETVFLLKRYVSISTQISKISIMDKTDPAHTINSYNDALDQVMEETSRPSPVSAIVKIVKSLPDNVRIRKTVIDIEKEKQVEFEGVVETSGPDQFKDSLSGFINSLNENMQVRQPITIQDVDFDVDVISKKDQSGQDYIIKLKFDLP